MVRHLLLESMDLEMKERTEKGLGQCLNEVLSSF